MGIGKRNAKLFTMTELVFATHNVNKVKEVKAVLPAFIKLRGLIEIGCYEELPETHTTIEDNSLEKAVYVHEKYGVNCFAEDSGLEVQALHGEPGVHSAHYSGSRNADENIEFLLHQLKGITNRQAQFKTVFTLNIENKKLQFAGKVTGNIALEPRGRNGFGYDSVFIPDGYTHTFAELSAAEKISISHRTKAFTLLIGYIRKNFSN